MAREKAQGAYESNKHDDFFHLKFPFQCPISKRDGLMRGSGVPIRKIDLVPTFLSVRLIMIASDLKLLRVAG